MIKSTILVLSWFVTGGLAYFSYQIFEDNQRLTNELSGLQLVRQQYQQQVDTNAQQRQEFETQIQQLQSSLLGAQTQMRNLSESLQEAREMIDPQSATTNTSNFSIPAQ